MLGNKRSSFSSGSSRKGKKGNNSDRKPKQPQRGLGVAQLEKIRLHGQLGCTYDLPTSIQYPYQSNLNVPEDMRGPTGYNTSVVSSANSYGFHPNMMMGFNEMERPNIIYGDSLTVRYNHGDNTIIESQDFAQPNLTRHLLNLQGEDSLHKKKRKMYLSDFMESSSQNSGSFDTQELDLELRLSL